MTDIGETMRALRNGTAPVGVVAHAEGINTVAEQHIQTLLDLHYKTNVLASRPDFNEDQLIAIAKQMHLLLESIDKVTAMSMIVQMSQMLIKAAVTAVQGGWRPSLEMLNDPQTLDELRRSGVTEEEINAVRNRLEWEQEQQQ